MSEFPRDKYVYDPDLPYDFDPLEYSEDFLTNYDYELEMASEELHARDSGDNTETFYTMDDPMVCPICLPFHGETSFIGSGPGIPIHLGCRCWKIFTRI